MLVASWPSRGIGSPSSTRPTSSSRYGSLRPDPTVARPSAHPGVATTGPRSRSRAVAIDARTTPASRSAPRADRDRCDRPGLILAAVLLLPGGGAVAGPLHDGLFAAFGVGAWIGVAGLVLTGSRLCLLSGVACRHARRLGSAVAMVALLGLAGMLGNDAGTLGRWVGDGVRHVLGGAGAGAAFVVIAFLGVILATDLRTGAALRAIGSWFAAEGAGGGEGDPRRTPRLRAAPGPFLRPHRSTPPSSPACRCHCLRDANARATAAAPTDGVPGPRGTSGNG